MSFPIAFPIPDMFTLWEFWVTAIACYIICEVIKRIPYVKKNERGWIVNAVNIIAGAIILTALLGSWGDPSSYIFGILASAISTLAYETFMNIFNFGKREDDVKVGGTDA